MAWFSPDRALLPEIIALNGRWLPHKPAVIVEGRSVSWSSFSEATAKIANGLLQAGLERGDRVIILSDNSLEMAEAIFGTIRAGLTVVPLNIAVTDDAVLNMIIDSGARAIVASGEHVMRIDALHERMPENIGDRYYAIDSPETRGAQWQDFWAMRDASPADAIQVKVHEDDRCNIIYSSGTTGLPKGIVHSHGCRAKWANDMAISLRYHSGARTLITLGMYSNITWVAMLATILAGGTLVIRSRFTEEDCLQSIARHRITHFAMVPVQYQRLLEYARFSEHDLSSLEAYMCCGSPLTPAMKTEIIERIPGRLIELYGLTEGLVTILSPEDMVGKLESVGRPSPGQDLRIVDDDDNELGPGQPGEIVGISCLMMSGYHNNDAATEAATWSGPNGYRWLRTGDIGRLDDDGFLYLVDRKKDLIISGGQNVYPADIEAVIATHEAIGEVAVIGVASRKWGETPVAIVAVRPGAGIDTEEFTAWVNAHVGKQQRIAATLVVDALPRNPNGKILKRELRRQFSSLEL
jgi:acyl-CoA synthetase (AMP-forming)/AMP-acid ligase II